MLELLGLEFNKNKIINLINKYLENCYMKKQDSINLKKILSMQDTLQEIISGSNSPFYMTLLMFEDNSAHFLDNLIESWKNYFNISFNNYNKSITILYTKFIENNKFDNIDLLKEGLLKYHKYYDTIIFNNNLLNDEILYNYIKTIIDEISFEEFFKILEIYSVSNDYNKDVISIPLFIEHPEFITDNKDILFYKYIIPSGGKHDKYTEDIYILIALLNSYNIHPEYTSIKNLIDLLSVEIQNIIYYTEIIPMYKKIIHILTTINFIDLKETNKKLNLIYKLIQDNYNYCKQFTQLGAICDDNYSIDIRIIELVKELQTAFNQNQNLTQLLILRSNIKEQIKNRAYEKYYKNEIYNMFYNIQNIFINTNIKILYNYVKYLYKINFELYKKNIINQIIKDIKNNDNDYNQILNIIKINKINICKSLKIVFKYYFNLKTHYIEQFLNINRIKNEPRMTYSDESNNYDNIHKNIELIIYTQEPQLKEGYYVINYNNIMYNDLEINKNINLYLINQLLSLFNLKHSNNTYDNTYDSNLNNKFIKSNLEVTYNITNKEYIYFKYKLVIIEDTDNDITGYHDLNIPILPSPCIFSSNSIFYKEMILVLYSILLKYVNNRKYEYIKYNKKNKAYLDRAYINTLIQKHIKFSYNPKQHFFKIHLNNNNITKKFKINIKVLKKNIDSEYDINIFIKKLDITNFTSDNIILKIIHTYLTIFINICKKKYMIEDYTYIKQLNKSNVPSSYTNS